MTTLSTGTATGTRNAPARPDAGACGIGWPALTAHRDELVAFARRRLHDPSLAEDLVHDVFEAVASGRAAFAGRSSLRTWLVGILKHKIIDLVRQRSGHDSLAVHDDDEGIVLTCPGPGPEDLAEQRQRLAQTLRRIEALPDTLRQVVELSLLRDIGSDEVCRAVGITKDNLFVRLHRARRVLAS